MEEKAPQEDQANQPESIKFEAILEPNGQWNVKCPLFADPKLRIVAKGFICEMTDVCKQILAEQATPRIEKPKGSVINFARKRFN